MASLAKPASPPAPAQPAPAQPAPTKENTIRLLKKNFKKIQRVLNNNNKDPQDGEDGKIYHYVEAKLRDDRPPRIFNLNSIVDVFTIQGIINMKPREAFDPEAEERRVQGIDGRGTRRRRRRRRSVRRKNTQKSSFMKKLRHKRRKKSKSHKKKHSGGGKKSRKSRKSRSCSIKWGGSQGYAFNGKIKNMALATPMPRTSYNTCES